MRRTAKPATAKGEAKLSVSRKAPKNEGARGRDLEKRLAEALGQLTEALARETATGEILRAISTSPSDLRAVLDTLVQAAARFCGAPDVGIFRVEGEQLRMAAGCGVLVDAMERQPGGLDRMVAPLTRGSLAGRAVLERRLVHVHDLAAESEDDFPVGRELQRRLGSRTTAAAPLLHDQGALGAIMLLRTEVLPFTGSQLGLLQTFAAQAVIAIENVRLFNETKEALDQQTATSEILRTIAQAQTDAQPVFDTIVRSVAQLCHATITAVFLTEGGMLYLPASYGSEPEAAAAIRARFPRPLDRETAAGTAILTRSVIHVPDVQEPTAVEFARQTGRVVGFRSLLSVPMLRQDEAVGAINVTRREPGAFSDDHVKLLKTFADQAVIAIENVRLFKELEERNRAVTEAHAQATEALEQQTATAEILRVISSSPTDLQPVFDAIVTSAVRLLRGYTSTLTRVVGDHLELVAITSTDHAGDAAVRARFPQSLARDDPHPHTVRARAPLNIADAPTDPRWPEDWRLTARIRGYRSLVVVPLLRYDEAIGTIAVARREPGGFTDDEIALLQTFADQAVIAIENARLLSELQERTDDLTRSVGELRALGEIGQAIGSTLELQTVLRTIAARATELAGADAGVIYEYDAQREVFEPRATERLEAEIVQALVATPVRKGQGATGRLAETREPIQLADVRSVAAQVPVREALIRAGYRALLAVPLLREDDLIGGLTVFRKTPGEFPVNVVALLRTFATQSALAIQNARLFRQLEIKSRELEVASQHKSEFLANMSHELRTPLNAIIGFSEVLGERLFGELNDKQEEYLKDIHASGQHLLSLINDILDLSKVEAGRMELELTDFDLPTALDNALTLVRERAGRRGIALHQVADEGLGQIRADERKIKQVLLNLLSNAIKFTPEGGRIDVRARPVDGSVEVSVTDTGVGIALEDQEAIFEEFRQVRTAAKKVEGTGLGLALSRKFVELHGGRIWVKSEMGVGSTFTFTIPVRHGE